MDGEYTTNREEYMRLQKHLPKSAVETTGRTTGTCTDNRQSIMAAMSAPQLDMPSCPKAIHQEDSMKATAWGSNYGEDTACCA